MCTNALHDYTLDRFNERGKFPSRMGRKRVGKLLMIEMQKNNHFTVTRQKSLKENQNWKVPPHAECRLSSPADRYLLVNHHQ